MLLKKIKKIPFENLGTCMREVKKKSIISPWIEDIFKNKKNIKYSKYQNFEIHKIK